MEITDRTGQPVTDEELDEALKAVETILVKQPLVLPLFIINGMAIRRALIELKQRLETDKNIQKEDKVMDQTTFNELVEEFALLASSFDWCVEEVVDVVWDGIVDAGMTWHDIPVTYSDVERAAERAKGLVAELKEFYESIKHKYLTA